MHDAWSKQAEELAEDISLVERWAETHPHLYAGSWYDNADFQAGAGAVCFVLATTAQPEDVRAGLTLDHPDRIRVVHHRHTYRELVALRDQIMADDDRTPRPPDATVITSAGPDVTLNRVAIAFSRSDAALAAHLVDRYGDDWVTVSDEPLNPVPLTGDIHRR